MVPFGPNGLIQEIPRKFPLLRAGAVPCFFPGCPKYLSVPESSHPCKLLWSESKETESFDQMINESRETFKLEEEKFNVNNFAELERKLNLVTSINWLLWSSDGSIHFILPHLENSMIRVEATLTIDSNLCTKAYFHNKHISLSLEFVRTIRQIETLLDEIIQNSPLTLTSPIVSTKYHIQSAKTHIIKVIDAIEKSDTDELHLLNEESASAYLLRLDFILCQLENVMVPKNSRKYNIITHVSHLLFSFFSRAFWGLYESQFALGLN